MARTLLRLLAVTVGVTAISLIGVACGSSSTSSTSPTAATAQNTIAYSRIVDLSHVISPEIPLWPGDPHVVFTVVATMAKDGYYLRKFAIGEHSATHMNAPNSFIAGNTQAITSYSPQQRVVPAVVIDVRDKCAANADYQLSKQDVLDWEAKNGRIAPGSFVIMLTGWEDKWSDPTAFIAQDAKGNLHFPGFAKATTMWLVDQRQIAGVGIDTHGVSPAWTRATPPTPRWRRRTRSPSSAWPTSISCLRRGPPWSSHRCNCRTALVRRMDIIASGAVSSKAVSAGSQRAQAPPAGAEEQESIGSLFKAWPSRAGEPAD